jgi:signal peptidase I
MRLRWFLSGTVRQATDMCKHVEKLINSQRDILSAQALAGITSVTRETQAAIASGADDAALRKRMEELEKAAGKWIKPYPNAEWRENVEVFLVAIVVAMAIRTFFLQPFKIPTGSMQPTLYGITEKDLRFERPAFQMPGILERIYDAAVRGTIYHRIIAQADGQVDLNRIGPVQHSFFINKQTLWVQYEGQPDEVPVTIWLGPDEHLEHWAGLDLQSVFRKGDPIVFFKETTGDHLFVDRLTYNFRPPKRGEIIVFRTKGIERIRDQDQFYIKRLIGLPDETVSIGEDRHVRIDGRRLDASTPHFENVYGFDPNVSPRESHYSGHVLESHSFLKSPEDTLQVPDHAYVAFGDNTVNSLDSRYWQFVPQENVIGKAFFIYWPIASESGPGRFGWGQR